MSTYNQESLLSKWKSRGATGTSHTGIPKAPPSSAIPLSYGQRRLWFLQQLYPNNPFYNITGKFNFQGPLDADRLTACLLKVYREHEILRTAVYLENGRLIQRADHEKELPLVVEDLSGMEPEMATSMVRDLEFNSTRTPFDLGRAPLIRITLIKRSNVDFILIVTMNHIIIDQWSLDLFIKEVSRHYTLTGKTESSINRPEIIAFSDYALWQRNKQINPEQLSYWKKKLSGDIPFLNLPVDYHQPANKSFDGELFSRCYSRELSDRILETSKTWGVTPYVFMLSVYYLLLNRCTGASDILIGSPISMRTRSELDNVLGFFDETIILRSQFNRAMTFTELVERVHKNTLEVFANMDVPLDVLVHELRPARSLGVNPFFQTMFIYQDEVAPPNFGPDITLHYQYADAGKAKFDLSLYISSGSQGITASFEYATDLFRRETIQSFHRYYERLLEGVLANPNEPISRIPMLPEKERVPLRALDPKQNRPFARYKGIHEIIEKICKEHPGNTALIFEGQMMSYRTLKQLSDILASRILSLTTSDSKIIGLCVEPSLDMIIGLIGILKAGFAYLPIDPEYPRDRITYMVKDSGASLVFTREGLTHLFKDVEIQKVNLEDAWAEPHPELHPLPTPAPEKLAYVIYTSGSTGKPKGIPVTHENILYSTEGRLNYYHENPTCFLLMSSLSFDSSKAGIYWTLCTGGTLVITRKRAEQDIEHLGKIIRDYKVSHTLMLPSLYHVLLDNCKPDNMASLNSVIVAGEACHRSLCRKHFDTVPNVLLYNEYGPSEATVWCVAHKLGPDDSEKDLIPIGKPVAHASVYLLDKNLEMVPPGIPAELYISGPGVCGGYLNNPHNSKNAFVVNPHNKDFREILYKTGDICRLNWEGNLEFIRRADLQIKIRGYRVELEEIENVIMEFPAVRKAVVLPEEPSYADLPNTDSSGLTEKLISFIDTHLTNNEVEELLDSVNAMSNIEKEYLLRSIKEDPLR